MSPSKETYLGHAERVIVFLPKSRDAESIPQVLEVAGVASTTCATYEDLSAEIDKGAGALIIEEEELTLRVGAHLSAILDDQPSWSELPIIVLLRHGPETRNALNALLIPGDVILVERPVRVNTLVAVVRSALRSRRRQYLVRDQLLTLEQLNTSLAARSAELEEANRSLETFNSAIAHDLRNPLNTIGSYFQVVKALCGDTLNEECKGYLEKGYDKVFDMSKLIGALLDFARMAQIEPHLERVDISVMAHKSSMALRQAEPERQVTFLIISDVMAKADPGLLQVVIDNLLGNAWKYTGMLAEAVIEFGVTQIGGIATYFVRDNGPGFSMADAEKLFVPFQRLPGTEKFQGFGIGLATVERIIHHHRGRIWAEGEPGKGATFYFTLSAG